MDSNQQHTLTEPTAVQAVLIQAVQVEAASMVMLAVVV
jgi:hypothetical protein